MDTLSKIQKTYLNKRTKYILCQITEECNYFEKLSFDSKLQENE